MVYKCCVPGCDSNYHTSTSGYVSVFSFPKDKQLKERWIKAIPRGGDWILTENSKVCIKHFHENDLEWYDTYFDKNSTVEMKWEKRKPSLKFDGVPRMFPNCPSYLSKDQAFRRQDPDERNKRRLENENLKKQKLAEKDLIKEYKDFRSNFDSRIKIIKDSDYQYFCSETVAVIYKMNYDNYPKVIQCIKILPDLSIQLFKENFLVDINDVTNIIPKINGGKLTRWTELSQILTDLDNFIKKEAKEEELLHFYLNQIKILGNQVTDLLDKGVSYSSENKLKFLIEQFSLLTAKKKKYSLDTTIMSFIIYSQSIGAYNAIRGNDILTLPHPSWLKKLESSFSIDVKDDSSNKHFLKFMCEELEPEERYVVLALDEIYVKECINYKNGEVTGFADNNPKEPAKTIQSFMIHSAFSDFKEIVSLIPVKNQSGVSLTELTKKAINLVQSCSFIVIALVCDDNKINQSLYSKLADSTGIKMQNPDYETRTIFLLFDPVHIFKNIRNNWINQKDWKKTFIFPDFKNILNDSDDNQSVIVKEACFSDLREFYSSEMDLLLKKAFKLNYKSLYPTNLERQKVVLVDNVFHDTTIAALKSVPLDHYTVEFLEIINQWWNIVNNKSTLKGIIKRKDLCLPFTDVNDKRFEFFEQFLKWLNLWHSLNLGYGTLTNDTYKAIYQTTSAIAELIKYSLQNLNVKYVLAGKFESDNLEKRFGRYRQLSGCSYNVTVTQIMEAEKKLRVKSVLAIHSARYGMVNYNTDIFNAEFEEDIDTTNCIVDPLAVVLTEDYFSSYNTEYALVVHIAGYCIRSTCYQSKCEQCKTLFEKGKKIDDVYFDHLQRGGLLVSNNFIFSICYHAIALMNYLISEKYELLFLQQKSQKAALKILSLKSIEQDMDLNEFLFEICFICGQKYKKIIDTVINKTCNILINNYTKKKNDEIARKKSNYTGENKAKIVRKYNNYD